MPLDEMLLWIEDSPRSGPENMVVDEWLLESATLPVLRVYRWEGDWASMGYFGKVEAARLAFGEINLVRRWTGGGFVDHRSDWTYSLVVPRGDSLAELKGGESYREIHSGLVAALQEIGMEARLATGEGEKDEALCFQNPVSHDVIGNEGRKIAGAGQRRSKKGLLHQGSVAVDFPDAAASMQFAWTLGKSLSVGCTLTRLLPLSEDIARRCASKYGRKDWMNFR